MTADIHKQEVLIEELPTTSVTIYPYRAHVVRDIKDIKIQPGLNEITIYGITPAADEHSVQVDGHGAATIIDMSVELVLNRERFADQFSDQDSDSDSEDADENAYKKGSLMILSDELKALRESIEAAAEKQKSANDQLRILNTFMDTINAKHNDPESASKAIASYGADRARIYEQWADSTKKIESLKKTIKQKEAKLQKEGKEERKQRKKQKEEREKRKALQQREARRAREEKAKFWPRKVYCVKLSLEASIDTPTSSRPASAASAASYPQLNEKAAWGGESEKNAWNSEEEKTVRLSLSYVVREVSWSPRYNVSISSQKKAATITYSAEFNNKTSETWKDAKVTLSTSQTSYSGLDDTVPELRPWPIFLRDKNSYDAEDDSVINHWNTKLSPQENHSGPNFNSFRPGQDMFNRFALFGPEPTGNPFGPTQTGGGLFGQLGAANQNHTGPAFGISGFGSAVTTSTSQGFGSANNSSVQPLFGRVSQLDIDGSDSESEQPVQSGGLFGRSNANTSQPAQAGGLFGNANANSQPAQSSSLFGSTQNNTQPAQSGGLFGGAPRPPTGALFGSARNNNIQTQAPVPPPPAPQAPSIHQEPTWEDSGMTTSYDLPGTRTIPPSSLSRRHKITTITIPNLDLSYIAIPKLRKGAFLRSKLRNLASPDGGITLLKGAAGLTLDGSFLGNTTLPRTSPSSDLDLDLGVDPAIHVTYTPPTLHRSTQGLLTRESAEAYARCIGITNTRAAAVKIKVLDQVPVSEQERLRVEVVAPKGLVKGGEGVVAGRPGEEEGDENWGKATAVMKDGGKVEWVVELEKGKSCRLPLEWEVRMPGDKRIAFA